MRDLTELAQKVWAAKSFEGKAVHIKKMIDGIKCKNTKSKFSKAALQAFSPKELDHLANRIITLQKAA
jgi:hypothetical protein